MKIVVDANVLIFANGFGIWDDVATWLERCELVLVTIQSVYGKETPDSLRPRLDVLYQEGLLLLMGDPAKVVQQPKDVRKLQKKIARAARALPPTSPVDQQLLLLTLREAEAVLLTDEKPLFELATRCNARCYDLLDLIEALFAAGAISEARRSELLEGRPGGRQESATDLKAELDERGGASRFACARS